MFHWDSTVEASTATNYAQKWSTESYLPPSRHKHKLKHLKKNGRHKFLLRMKKLCHVVNEFMKEFRKSLTLCPPNRRKENVRLGAASSSMLLCSEL